MESPGSQRLGSRHESSSSRRNRSDCRSPRRTRNRSRSPRRNRDGSHSPHRDGSSKNRNGSRSPSRNKNNSRFPFKNRKGSRSPRSNRNSSRSPHRYRSSSPRDPKPKTDVAYCQNVITTSLNIDDFGSMDSDNEEDRTFPVYQHVVSSHDQHGSVVDESIDGVPINQSQISSFNLSSYTQIAASGDFQSCSRYPDLTEKHSAETKASSSSAKYKFPRDPQLAMQSFIEALKDPESFKNNFKNSHQDRDPVQSTSVYNASTTSITSVADYCRGLDVAASDQINKPRSTGDSLSRETSKEPSKRHSKGSEMEDKGSGKKNELKSVKLAWHSTPVDRRKGKSEVSSKREDTKSKNPLLNSLKQATRMGLGAVKSKVPKRDEEETNENMDLSLVSSVQGAMLQNNVVQSIPQPLQELLQTAIKGLAENAFRTIQQASIQSLSNSIQPFDIGHQQTMQLPSMHGMPQNAMSNIQQQHFPNVPPPDFMFQHNMPPSGMQGIPQNAMGNMPPPDLGFQHNMPPPGMQGIPQGFMENMPPPGMQCAHQGFMENMSPPSLQGLPQNHMVSMPPPSMLGIPQNHMMSMPPPSMQDIPRTSLSNPPLEYVTPPPQLDHSISSSSPVGSMHTTNASRKRSRFDVPPPDWKNSVPPFNKKPSPDAQTKQPIPVTIIHVHKPPTSNQTKATPLVQKKPLLKTLLSTAQKTPPLLGTPPVTHRQNRLFDTATTKNISHLDEPRSESQGRSPFLDPPSGTQRRFLLESPGTHQRRPLPKIAPTAAVRKEHVHPVSVSSSSVHKKPLRGMSPSASAQMKPPPENAPSVFQSSTPNLNKDADVQKRPSLLDKALTSARSLLDSTQPKPLFATHARSSSTTLAKASQGAVIAKVTQHVDEVLKKVAPDGTGSVKFPAPDTNSLIFDPDVGFRYDVTTGLHYDANSGYFFNSKLQIFLYWDMFTQTYLKVDNPKIPFPVLQNRKDSAESKIYTESHSSGTIINMKELIERNRQIKLEQDKAHQNALARSMRRSRSRSRGRDWKMSRGRDQSKDRDPDRSSGSRKRRASPGRSDDPKKYQRRSRSPQISLRRTSNSPEAPKGRDARDRGKSPDRHGRHHLSRSPQRKSKSPLGHSKVRSRSPGPLSKEREEQRKRSFYPPARYEKDNKGEGKSGRREETLTVSENYQVTIPPRSKWELDETTEKDNPDAGGGTKHTSCSDRKASIYESTKEKEKLTYKQYENLSRDSKRDQYKKDSGAARKQQDSSYKSKDTSRDKENEKTRSAGGNSIHERQKKEDKRSKTSSDPRSSDKKTSTKENDNKSLDKKSDRRDNNSSNVGGQPYKQKENNSSINEGRNHRLVSERRFIGSGTKNLGRSSLTFPLDETSKSDSKPENLLDLREEEEAKNIHVPLGAIEDLSDFVVLDGVEDGEDSGDEMTEEALELLLADDNENEKSEDKEGEERRITSKGHPAITFDDDNQEEKAALSSSEAVENENFGTTNTGEKKPSGDNESQVKLNPYDIESIEKSSLDQIATYSQPPSPAGSIFSSYDFSDDEKFMTTSAVREAAKGNLIPKNDCVEGTGDRSSVEGQKQEVDSAIGTSNDPHSEFHNRVTILPGNVNAVDAGKLMNEAGNDSIKNSDVNNAAKLIDSAGGEFIGNDEFAKLMNKTDVDSTSKILCPTPSMTAAEEPVDKAGDVSTVNSNVSDVVKLMNKAGCESVENSETNEAAKLMDEICGLSDASNLCPNSSVANIEAKVIGTETSSENNDGAVGVSQMVGLEKLVTLVQKTAKTLDNQSKPRSIQPVDKDSVASEALDYKNSPKEILGLKPLDTEQSHISQSVQKVKGTKNLNAKAVEVREVKKDSNTSPDKKDGSIFSRLSNLKGTPEKVSKNRVPGDKDPLSDLYPSTPTCFVHLKSGYNGCNTVTIKNSLKNNLLSYSINYQKILMVQKNNHGTPYEHLTVLFKSPLHAELWFKKTNRKITLQFREGQEVTYYMYYAEESWRCNKCHSGLNIFYRSLCCLCYTHKSGAPAPVTFCDKPTRYLGVNKLPLNVSESNVMSYFPKQVFQTFHLRSVEIVEDPEMKCCAGLVVVETQNLDDAIAICSLRRSYIWPYVVKFIQYDDNHPETLQEMTTGCGDEVQNQVLDEKDYVSGGLSRGIDYEFDERRSLSSWRSVGDDGRQYSLPERNDTLEGPSRGLDDEFDERRSHSSWRSVGDDGRQYSLPERNDTLEGPSRGLDDESDERRSHSSWRSVRNDGRQCTLNERNDTLEGPSRGLDDESDERRSHSSWRSVGDDGRQCTLNERNDTSGWRGLRHDDEVGGRRGRRSWRSDRDDGRQRSVHKTDEISGGLDYEFGERHSHSSRRYVDEYGRQLADVSRRDCQDDDLPGRSEHSRSSHEDEGDHRSRESFHDQGSVSPPYRSNSPRYRSQSPRGYDRRDSPRRRNTRPYSPLRRGPSMDRGSPLRECEPARHRSRSRSWGRRSPFSFAGSPDPDKRLRYRPQPRRTPSPQSRSSVPRMPVPVHSSTSQSSEPLSVPTPDGRGSNWNYPPPEPSTFRFDPISGLHFDPQTGLYFDRNSGSFYNGELNIHMEYDSRSNNYLAI